MDWIIQVRVIYDTGRLYKFFGEWKSLEFLKKLLDPGSFYCMDLFELLIIIQEKCINIIYQTIAMFIRLKLRIPLFHSFALMQWNVHHR